MNAHGCVRMLLVACASMHAVVAAHQRRFLQSESRAPISIASKSSEESLDLKSVITTVNSIDKLAGAMLFSPPPTAAMEDPQLQFSSRTFLAYLSQVVASWTLVILTLLVALFCCYRPCSPPPTRIEGVPALAFEDLQDLQKGFTNGHWMCLEDSSTCICSFLCPILRWSDTASLAYGLGFFAAFALISLMLLFNMFVAVGPFFTAGLMCYYRQELRQKLKLDHHTCGTCCIDCCYVFWCPCCALAQEARIVKNGIQSGVEEFAYTDVQRQTDARL